MSTRTKIISRLTTTDQISKFVNSPSWSIREFEQSSEEANNVLLIDVAKFNKLSGLNFKEDNTNVIRKQINFISHLHKYDLDKSITPKVHSGVKLTFEKLNDQIKNLKSDDSKGEKNDWGPMQLPKLKSKDYYVLREGLYK